MTQYPSAYILFSILGKEQGCAGLVCNAGPAEYSVALRVLISWRNLLMKLVSLASLSLIAMAALAQTPAAAPKPAPAAAPKPAAAKPAAAAKK